MHAGYREEAQAWGAWLRRSVAGTPAQIQTLYGLAGERWLMEWEVPWLAGYGGARPVRIGNAASAQLQLDVYGELMDALYQEMHLGLARPNASWGIQRALSRTWRKSGSSRTRASGRCAAASGNSPSPRRWPGWRWTARSAARRNSTCREGSISGARCASGSTTRSAARATTRRSGSFVQYYGGDELDASLLLLPLVGFLPPEDPRIKGTVAAIQRELTVDGLVLRYRTREAVDGLPPGEGVFLACSFWLADNLILQGRKREARALFERLLGLCNDVGLLAEEYDPRARRQLGNFPAGILASGADQHRAEPAQPRSGAPTAQGLTMQSGEAGFHPAPRPEAPPLDSAKRRALGTQYFQYGIAKAPPLLGVLGAKPPGGFQGGLPCLTADTACSHELHRSVMDRGLFRRLRLGAECSNWTS